MLSKRFCRAVFYIISDFYAFISLGTCPCERRVAIQLHLHQRRVQLTRTVPPLVGLQRGEFSIVATCISDVTGQPISRSQDRTLCLLCTDDGGLHAFTYHRTGSGKLPHFYKAVDFNAILTKGAGWVLKNRLSRRV